MLGIGDGKGRGAGGAEFGHRHSMPARGPEGPAGEGALAAAGRGWHGAGMLRRSFLASGGALAFQTVIAAPGQAQTGPQPTLPKERAGHRHPRRHAARFQGRDGAVAGSADGRADVPPCASPRMAACCSTGAARANSAMWMRNTISSLDMVFITADGHIHRIAERTVPYSLATIESRGPVRATLELAAGTAERLGLQGRRPGAAADLRQRSLTCGTRPPAPIGAPRSASLDGCGDKSAPERDRRAHPHCPGAPGTIGCGRRGVAQSGSASALGAEGRRFESSRPDTCVEDRHMAGPTKPARIYHAAPQCHAVGPRQDPGLGSRIRAG